MLVTGRSLIGQLNNGQQLYIKPDDQYAVCFLFCLRSNRIEALEMPSLFESSAFPREIAKAGMICVSLLLAFTLQYKFFRHMRA